MSTRNLIANRKADLIKLALAGISGGAMVLAFPDYDFYLLEWVALVPLLFALEGVGYRKTYILSVLIGTLSVCGAFPWMHFVVGNFIGIPSPFNYLVWLLYGFFNAQLFAAIFLAHAFIRRHSNLPSLLVLPAITVAFWSVFPTIFHFTLANGTSGFLPALQATEFTGPYGLDLMIVLVNVIFYHLLRLRSQTAGKAGLLIALAVVLAWFGYGSLILKQWDDKIAGWQTKGIGIVQSNRPSSLTPQKPGTGFSWENPLEMDLSRSLAAKGAGVIIWPEGHFYGFGYSKTIIDAYFKAVKEMGISLVFNDKTPSFTDGRLTGQQTSAIWLKKNGTFGGDYHKRVLVPFGEYFPIIGKITWLTERLKLPHGTQPGDKAEIFRIDGMKMVPLICYEIQFGDFAAESLERDGKGKVIIVQSNDGWYGKGAQSDQHRSSNVLRAVENRVPVVHVINNGRSSIVSPNGRTVFLSESWVRGAWKVDMPYDPNSGGSFYTRYPWLFLNAVRLVAVLLIVFALAARRKAKFDEMNNPQEKYKVNK